MRLAGAAVLIVLSLALAGEATAAPTLVRVRGEGAFAAQAAGAMPVSRELGIWRLDGREAARLVPRLRAAGVLVTAEPERVLTTDAASISTQFTDPLVGSEWWLAAIGADQAEPPGPGIPLTIIDSGLDVTHPEFANRPNLTLLNVQTTFGRDETHGTEVSSLAAAPNNGVGVDGVYPQANLRMWDASPVRGITNTEAILGIERAVQDGPGVVNMSWGSETPDSLIEAAILRGIRAGLLFVAASGNSRDSGSPRDYPASLPHVLSVGATDKQNVVTSFSTASSALGLVAPGQDLTIADPRSPGLYDPSGAGTSFSAPIVSGAAAWIWTARPTLDNTQIFDLLRSTATDLGPRGWDPDYGFGLLNIPAALSAPELARDPLEPNDDIYQVSAGQLFPEAAPPLTSRAQPRNSVVARVDSAEDPRDVYRVFFPAGKRVTFALRGVGLSVTAWRASTRSVLETGAARRADLLGAGTTTLTVRSGSRSFYGFASVQPESGLRMAGYMLTVSSR